jgi:phosphoribosylanthranilate isomerase
LTQLRELSPHGVDLNSGVEFSPGVKDAGLIRKTLEKINQGVECGNEKS